MGWKQAIRQAEAAHRRHERESARRQKELAKRHAQLQKQQERAWNENVVETHQNLIEVLTSLHRDTASPVDWNAVSATADPTPVRPVVSRQEKAKGDLLAYVPGFFAKLFGSDKKVRAALEAKVAAAAAEDDAETAQLQKGWEREVAERTELRRLAHGVLAGDKSSYREVLNDSDAFEELKSHRIGVAIVEVRDDCVLFAASPGADDILPGTDMKLTASGKVTEKDTPAGTYALRYQDFLCSTALRLVAEALALLPLRRAVCNVGVRRLNPATGHMQLDCLVALHATREAVQAVNLPNVDASDAMKNFQSRMDFKKAGGFVAVEEISLDDQWVTT